MILNAHAWVLSTYSMFITYTNICLCPYVQSTETPKCHLLSGF